MCYDKRSSLIAGSVGYLFALAIYLRNQGDDRWISIFIFTYAAIQFLEAGVWHSIDNNNPKQNDFFTRLILIAIWMQPVVMTLCGILFGKRLSNNLNTGLRIVFILSCLLLASALLRVINKKRKFQSKIGPNGHLVWQEPTSGSDHFINIQTPRLSKLIYVVGMFLPYLFMANGLRTMTMASIVGLSLAYNYVNYYHTGEFSSMWCYHAIAMAVSAWFIV